ERKGGRAINVGFHPGALTVTNGAALGSVAAVQIDGVLSGPGAIPTCAQGKRGCVHCLSETDAPAAAGGRLANRENLITRADGSAAGSAAIGVHSVADCAGACAAAGGVNPTVASGSVPRTAG